MRVYKKIHVFLAQKRGKPRLSGHEAPTHVYNIQLFIIKVNRLFKYGVQKLESKDKYALVFLHIICLNTNYFPLLFVAYHNLDFKCDKYRRKETTAKRTNLTLSFISLLRTKM